MGETEGDFYCILFTWIWNYVNTLCIQKALKWNHKDTILHYETGKDPYMINTPVDMALVK